MGNLARKSIPALAALSLMTMSALAGAQESTTQQLPSTRDPHSTWIITKPTRQFDPVTHRHLIGTAQRRTDAANQAPHDFYRTAADAQKGKLAQDAAAMKATLAAGAAAGANIASYPTFFTSFVNDNLVETQGAGVYSFMGIRVGADPASSNTTTTIPTYIVPVVITAPDGTVYSPYAKVPGQTGSTIDMHLQSPMFQLNDLQFAGHDFGTTQLMDAWTRASDWSTVKAEPNFHLMLGTPTMLPPLKLTPTASQFASFNLGPGSGLYGSTINVLNINYLDNQIRDYIAHSKKISAAGVPVFLTSYNVEASGAGGYHDTDGNQVYTWVGYFVSSQMVGNGFNDSLPSALRDGTVLEHEFAELIDHPFVETGDNGPCSDWGYEVGDPLESGQNDFTLPDGNGHTYGYQDLTFYSYNIGDMASKGIRGQFTLQNTYTRACAGM